jgi:hypothetical protein
MSAESIERLIGAVLEACGIDSTPPISLGSLAAALGVAEIRRASMVEDGRLEQRDGRTVIWLRDETGPQRQRFTLAHELAHLILAEPDRDFVAHRRELQFSSEERFCDQFAASLLMPSDWVRREFADAPIRLGVARNMAAQAEASLSASLVRLREVLGWEASMLHWRHLQGQWRLISTAGLPRTAQNRVASNPETRQVLDRLSHSPEERRGMLPLWIGDSAFQVPVEIMVRRHSAIGLAFFNDPRIDPCHTDPNCHASSPRRKW